MARKALRKLLLSLAVSSILTLSWSGAVLADGSEVDALEARVAELEELVHKLLQAKQTQAPAPAPKVDTAALEAKAEEAAEAKVTAMLEDHQSAVAEKVHKHSYKFGGYIKTDVMFSDFGGGSVGSGSAGRDFYIPAVVPAGDSGESYLDFNIKESRINFRSTHNLDNGAKLGTFMEFDMQLSGHGDERISNSYNPRVRHAFFTYNNWLVGQTWMTFFNVGALPENLDFVGPAESTVFGRQAMIRYTNGNWQLAFENPETTVTPGSGGGRVVADDSKVPDVVLRYNLKGDWGGFTAAGMVRQLACDGCVSGVDDTTTGFALSLSGKFVFGNKDDFRWMASTGNMGRYIGLNISNGAVVDADGNLESIDQTGIFGSYRHLWNNKWRSNLTLGYLNVDNDTDLTGMGATKKMNSMHVNLIYSPQPKLDFGGEIMYADRELESGADGDLTRLQFSAKYAF
jgi:hypothetical protein